MYLGLFLDSVMVHGTVYSFYQLLLPSLSESVVALLIHSTTTHRRPNMAGTVLGAKENESNETDKMQVNNNTITSDNGKCHLDH